MLSLKDPTPPNEDIKQTIRYVNPELKGKGRGEK